MREISRVLRIIAGLMLIGSGLGLVGVLVHTERTIYAPAIVKARRSHIHAVPASTSPLSHSRHSQSSLRRRNV